MKKHFSIALALLVGSHTSGLQAQTSGGTAAEPTAATKPADSSPTLLQMLKLPELRDLKLQLPRTVQAANALLGLTTQRLALVIGTGNIGPQIQLPAVSRDTQAVAAALRAAGFVVMVREDLNAEDMRATLEEFRNRLHPGGVGFLYFAGLGAQLGGENVILTRGLTVTGTGPETRIKGTAVPLQEVVDAVQGTPESPRYLVVDAAFSHPTLAALGSKGLGPQKLPAGLMGLFSQSPGAVGAPPEPFVLPLPTPTDPRLLAGSPFGRELVRSLVTPKLSGGDVLRVTRGAMLDVSGGQQAPVLVGESTHKDEFAEPNLLDALFPRTPEDMAREALKQALRTGSSAGEVPVSQLTATPTTPGVPNTSATLPTTPTTSQTQDLTNDARRTDMQRNAADTASRRLADAPSPTSALSTAATAATAATGVAGAAATTAAVAGTVATGAVMAKATAATTAVGVVGSVASSAVGVLSSVASLVSGGGTSGGGAATAVAASEASKLVRPASAAAAAIQARDGVSNANATSALPAAQGVGARQAAPLAAPTTQAAANLATGQDLPVSAINQPAVPNAASTANTGTGTGTGTPAQAAGEAGLPPATPRTAVPQNFSAADTVAASNPAANPSTAPRTQSQQGGGERPAYIPKVNPFGYAEGDTFMYRVMDTWKNQHMGNTVQTVEEVLPNGSMVANGQQTVLDPQGRFMRVQNLDGSVSQFEPAQELWWSNPARGQSRDVLFKERFQRADNSRGQTEWKGSTSVGRPRTISTPGGDFEVLPIESSGWFYEQVGRGPLNSGQWSRTVWYSPKLGHPVAIDIEDANALGKLLRRERIELLQAHTARSSAATP